MTETTARFEVADFRGFDEQFCKATLLVKDGDVEKTLVVEFEAGFGPQAIMIDDAYWHEDRETAHEFVGKNFGELNAVLANLVAEMRATD